jgi:hypothetical protein
MMISTTVKNAERGAQGQRSTAAVIAFLLLTSVISSPAAGQNAPTAEEARLVEFGKEIFKSKAVCQYCHKWDASGDQGYGGNALSLRATHLTPRTANRSREVRSARYWHALS